MNRLQCYSIDIDSPPPINNYPPPQQKSNGLRSLISSSSSSNNQERPIKSFTSTAGQFKQNDYFSPMNDLKSYRKSCEDNLYGTSPIQKPSTNDSNFLPTIQTFSRPNNPLDQYSKSNISSMKSNSRFPSIDTTKSTYSTLPTSKSKPFDYSGSSKFQFIDDDVIVDSNNYTPKWTSNATTSQKSFDVKTPTYDEPKKEELKKQKSRFSSLTTALPLFSSATLSKLDKKSTKSIQPIDPEIESTLPKFSFTSLAPKLETKPSAFESTIKPSLPTTTLPRFSSSVLTGFFPQQTNSSSDSKSNSKSNTSTSSRLDSISRSSSLKSTSKVESVEQMSPFPKISTIIKREDTKLTSNLNRESPTNSSDSSDCNNNSKLKLTKIDEVTQRLSRHSSCASKCNCAGEREKRWKRSIKPKIDEKEEMVKVESIPPKTIEIAKTSNLLNHVSKPIENNDKKSDDIDEEMRWQEEMDNAEEQRFLRIFLKKVKID